MKKRLIRAEDTKYDKVAELLKQMSDADLFFLAQDLDEHAHTKFLEGIVTNNNDELNRIFTENDLSYAQVFEIGLRMAKNGYYDYNSPFIYYHKDTKEIESIPMDYVKKMISNSDNIMADFVVAVMSYSKLESIPQEIRDVING